MFRISIRKKRGCLVFVMEKFWFCLVCTRVVIYFVLYFRDNILEGIGLFIVDVRLLVFFSVSEF